MLLSELIAKPLALPSTPKVIALLMSELDKSTADLKNITQLIATDPALTCTVLQLANAAGSQLAGKISSVSEALALLGMSAIRAMVVQAANTASALALPGLALRQFCAYSLTVAKLSRSLAGVVRQNQGAAYTCGLMHAMGELAMHLAMPEKMANIDAEAAVLDLRRVRLELRELGYSYADVGAGLARAWSYPQAMVDALEHQDAPFERHVYEPLAGVIHLAVWRARAREAQLSDKALAVTFPVAVGDALGLDIDRVLQQDPFDWSAHA
jgi:HD-like signal output (HDOD) protein